MRILTLGDPHIRLNNLHDINQLHDHVLELLSEHNPDMLVVLGDVLHTHATINSHALVAAVNFLYLLSKNVPLMMLIIGNHDRPNANDFLSDIHPFTAMHRWKNVIVVDKVVDITLKGFNIIGVPYVPAGRFMEALATNENSSQADIIFCHQDFYGAKYSNEQAALEGDKVNLKNTLIISGHIHAYQKLGKGIIYVGTPMQQDFGEDENKGISMFNFSLSKDKNYMSRGRFFWQEERFMSRIPPRVLVSLRVDEILSYKPPDNVRLQIVLRGSPEEFNSLQGNKHICSLERSGIKIQYRCIESSHIDDNTNITINRKSFLETLRENISNDLVETYNMVFN